MPSTVSPPATMGEALAQLDAALRFLDEAGFAQLPPEVRWSNRRNRPLAQ